MISCVKAIKLYNCCISLLKFLGKLIIISMNMKIHNLSFKKKSSYA
ncbi:hypothetical protein A1OE_1161 [Candidatus Endolissoclinum faulkneri L2]|uniref:Uncharacterized protein n=1 Tax=Candidatus Endolissoclinum faulkneri L2 TaxID=1193729 RepID=K7YS17_9PROT|nr:hypothetical protein A1OE_1161 [Candidatus Endolissoclinum faulkneri L2]